MESNLLVILGPTASGKTRVGVQVAKVLGGEIVSADSRQVYRGMDIGTGKDLGEYGAVPYHLIDIIEPGQEFSVFEFHRRFGEAFSNIRARGRLPILVGGTGMYLDAVLSGYRLAEVPENPILRRELLPLTLEELAARLKKSSPRLHNTTDLFDRARLIRAIEIAEFKEEKNQERPSVSEIKPVVFGLKWPRNVLRQRITQRLRERLKGGLIEEVDRLHKAGVSFETFEFYGLEYRFVARFLKGELRKNDMFQKLNSAIYQLAKRQDTWFRRMERQGIAITWVDGDKDPAFSILQQLRESDY